MPIEYVLITDNCIEDYIGLPTQEDGSLALRTLSETFPGCCGLTYVHPTTSNIRGLRLKDGRLYPPSEGWSSYKYLCNFPKEVIEKPYTKIYQKEATDLIVLGLAWKSTEDTIREYFETFGKVRKVWLKKTAEGKSKGFAFIRFATYYTQMKVLTKTHIIDGRRCDVLIPHSKRGLPFKVFVGGCPEDLTVTDLHTYFSQYGPVTDVFLPKPYRPFAFVTFLDSCVAKNVCDENHFVNGVTLNVSVAVPKLTNSSRYASSNQGELSLISHGENEYSDQMSTHYQWTNNNCNIDLLNMQNLHISKTEMSSLHQNCSNSFLNPFSLPVNTSPSMFNQSNWGISPNSTWNEISSYTMPNIHQRNTASMSHGSETVFPWFPNTYQGASTDYQQQLFPAPVYQDNSL